MMSKMKQNNTHNQRKTSIGLSNRELQKKIAGSSTIHDNLGEKYLMISESKVKLCLKDNIDHMESRKAWQAPAGIAFTIFITLLTSNFKDKFLPSATWQALFILVGLLSIFWLLVALYKAPKFKSVNDIVGELMPPTNE